MNGGKQTALLEMWLPADQGKLTTGRVLHVYVARRRGDEVQPLRPKKIAFILSGISTVLQARYSALIDLIKELKSETSESWWF